MIPRANALQLCAVVCAGWLCYVWWIQAVPSGRAKFTMSTSYAHTRPDPELCRYGCYEAAA